MATKNPPKKNDKNTNTVKVNIGVKQTGSKQGSAKPQNQTTVQLNVVAKSTSEPKKHVYRKPQGQPAVIQPNTALIMQQQSLIIQQQNILLQQQTLAAAQQMMVATSSTVQQKGAGRPRAPKQTETAKKDMTDKPKSAPRNPRNKTDKTNIVVNVKVNNKN